jgi:hypothetical protein
MFSANRKQGQLRRIVTGFNGEGKSVIESDQMLDPQRIAPDGSSFSSTVWTTDSSPANVLDPVDGATRPLQGMGIRAPNGLILVCGFGYSALSNISCSGTLLKYHEMLGGASPMHLTKSVDYAIVMEGEMEMHLDDGSCTVLHQGRSLQSLSSRLAKWLIIRGYSDPTRNEPQVAQGEGR